MITQIEINGFKTFKDFKVELAPFQVIVGPNGSGKSNLFDALQLLSRLAEKDFYEAFHGLRGDPGELFTKYPDGSASDRIKISVEMLIDKKVKDILGGLIELKYNRLRYELEIALITKANELSQWNIRYEALKIIPSIRDNWSKKYNLNLQNEPLPEDMDDEHTFFSLSHGDRGKNIFNIYSESHVSFDIQKKQSFTLNAHYVSANLFLSSTILSSDAIRLVSGISATHAFAVREQLRALRFLHLSPATLRQPSSANAPRFLSSNGGNLPTTLARMQAQDKFALTDVSLTLSSLVPDLVEIELKKDEIRNEYTIWAKYVDGRVFSSRVLSDGTLQLLALATLKCDPQFRGVLCFEEPENAIHPSYLTNIAHLLRGLATDFSDPQWADEPLRQVLVTTHSPTFISQPDVIDALLFTYTMTRVEPSATGLPPMRFTHAAPVRLTTDSTENADMKDEATYTIALVKDLLMKNQLEEAIERLDEAKTKLNEE